MELSEALNPHGEKHLRKHTGKKAPPKMLNQGDSIGGPTSGSGTIRFALWKVGRSKMKEKRDKCLLKGQGAIKGCGSTQRSFICERGV